MNESNEKKTALLADDEKEKSSPLKRREIVKTLIIIFLAAMLVLTFFSNTIMNKSLPEITTVSASSGKLTERIREKGVVESNQVYNVTADANKVVEKINIKRGQEVKKGDVLFVLKNVDDEKLELAENDYLQAKIDYETALLKDPVDYSSENQEIKAAREALNSAIAKRDAARSNEGAFNDAKNRYRENNAELKRLTAKKDDIRSALRAVNSDSFDEDVPYEYISDLPSLYSSFAEADEEYKNAYALYEKAIESGENIDITKADADAKKAVRDTANDTYKNAKNSLRNSLTEQYNQLDGTINDLTNQIEAYEAQYGEGENESYETLDADVVEKRSALEKLIVELDKSKRSDNIKDKKLDIEIESKKTAFEKQKEKYEKLKKDTESTEIKSKYSGIVSSVNVQPDEKTEDGNPLATIDLVDEGFTVSISVEAEKTKKIKKGVEAEIVNNYDDDTTAVLSEIKSDPKSGSKNKTLVFNITGDVNSGDSIYLSIPCGSGTYDSIVPRSAVRKGDNEKYVFVVRSKNTPLGNRYYAEKVVVNEEATDEVSCAVSGGLNPGDYVITAASKPVSAGDQVRIKDK
jgi:multidrug efflux pump subunit AcrA (membrane-fusion protein)